MATETTTQAAEQAFISIKPTPTWVPLKIEGTVPDPYRVSNFNLRVTPLHPTFACELEGVDWTQPISPDLYEQIRKVVDQVRPTKEHSQGCLELSMSSMAWWSVGRPI